MASLLAIRLVIRLVSHLYDRLVIQVRNLLIARLVIRLVSRLCGHLVNQVGNLLMARGTTQETKSPCLARGQF